MSRSHRKWRNELHDFWQRQSEGERMRIIWVVVIVAIGAVALPTWKLAGPIWRQWRVDRALDQAHAHAANDNDRGLLLALQRASQLAPGDTKVWQTTAGYLAELGSPEAITAYENLLRLGVEDASVRQSTAEQALRLNDPARARAALATAAEADQNHRRLAAAIALRLGEPWTAEQELRALLQHTPNDPEARYNLAILQLPQPDKNSAARQVLWELTEIESLQLKAWLALVRDSSRQRDATAVTTVMQAALASSANTPAVAPARPEEMLRAFVERIKKVATAGSNAEVVATARWLEEIRRGDEALAWLLELPPERQTDPEVRRCLTSLSLSEDHWASSVGLLTGGGLGVLSPEAGTLALAARQQLLMNRRQRAETTWNDAVMVAGSAPTSHDLHTLVHVASIWSEPVFLESSLRELLRRQPENSWARTSYARQLMLTGRATELTTHLEAWLRSDTGDRVALLFAVRLAATGSPGVTQTLDLETRVNALESTDPTARLVKFAWAVHHRRLVEAESFWAEIPPGARATPEARYWQAVWAWERGRFDDARAVASTLTRGAFFPGELERLRRMFGQP